MTISTKFLGSSALILVMAAMPALAADNTAPAAVGLEEVVVTAQKRVENAQKAPLAVTSLTADALATAHVTGATDLERVVPDVRVDVGGATGGADGSNAVFSIRGLGASATGPQGSPGVAVHFDGVYRQNGISNDEFFDLERIEVDPGPQGTLYGRSAAAGAVNVIPNKPTDKFEGLATVEVGNYAAIRSTGMINVPVNDMIDVRAAFQTQKHDGYLSNGYDDQDAYAGRLQVLFKPTPDLSIRAYGDYTHIGGVGAGDVFVGPSNLPSFVPQAGNSDLRKAAIDSYCFVGGQIVNTCQQSIDATKFSAHLDINYDLGWGILSILPAYNEQDANNKFVNAPLPFSYFNQAFNQRQMNFETRLNDAGDTKVKWVGGINIYHNETDPNINAFVFPLTPVPTPRGIAQGVVSINTLNNQTSNQDSYAVFGQTTYPVTDWLRLTGGARYNYDSSGYLGSLTTLSQQVYIVNGPLVATQVASPITTGALSSNVRFRALTYRFSVDADITPDSLVYASYGTGYKPGGLSDGAQASANTPGQLAVLGSQLAPPLTAAQLVSYEPSQSFGPEKVTHYEIGTKNRFWNNHLQINDTIYYDDYSNYQNGQTEVVNPIIFRDQGFIVSNAGKSKVYGSELSIKYKLTANDLIQVAINYLHSTFTSYLAPAYLTPSGPVPAISYAGKTLPNSPSWSGSVGYQHFFDLPDGAQVAASLFTALSGSEWVYFAQSAGTHQGAYTRTTLDLTWNSANEKWSATVFVNNLEDRTIKTFGTGSAGYSLVNLAPPRTFGASATFRF